MEQHKITIIVPIYGVEAYLPRCLDSILAQTYQNLQIILVDDGSPDKCGQICDAYAQLDSRIEVIHRPNCGVAAARNAGLSAAQGDWIGWVDADDWIENDMFAYLLEHALAAQADICVCGRYEELRRRTALFGWPHRALLNRTAAMKALLEDRYLDNALYDKLWKKELFDGIQFPAGHTYEDLATVYRLFERASAVLCLPMPKYHYRRRADSITGNTALHNRMEHYLAAQQRRQSMAADWPEFMPLLEQRCITAAVGLWVGCNRASKSERRQYASRLRGVSQFVKPRLAAAKKDTSCGLAGQMILRLLPYNRSWAYLLAGLIGWLYQCKHGRTL